MRAHTVAMRAHSPHGSTQSHHGSTQHPMGAHTVAVGAHTVAAGAHTQSRGRIKVCQFQFLLSFVRSALCAVPGVCAPPSTGHWSDALLGPALLRCCHLAALQSPGEAHACADRLRCCGCEAPSPALSTAPGAWHKGLVIPCSFCTPGGCLEREVSCTMRPVCTGHENPETNRAFPTTLDAPPTR